MITILPVFFNPAKDWKSSIAFLKDSGELTAE
jgi:hypothetical protein